MRGRRKARLAAATLAASALLGAAGARSQEATSATARLEPGLIGIGQIATLTLEAQSSGLTDLQLDPQFSLTNLEIVSGPMQSQSWQFVNGRASRSESLIWRLRGKAVGPAQVTGISLKVNDAVFELPDQVLEIQRDPVQGSDRNGRSRFPDLFEDSPFSTRPRARSVEAEPELFLRAEVTPREAFVGQQVLYTLYLFTQADVGAINPESVPGFEGFWVEDVPQPERLQPDMVELQGKRYGRVVLLRKAVFPRSPGKVEVEPVRARLIASVPEYSWMGSVINRRRELHRTSNAVTIDVKPLPEAPAGFGGAVGELELSARLEPPEVRVGEAATLTVTLEGVGNIQGVLEPDLPVLEGIRVYPPEQSSRSGIAGTRVRGEKSWKYVLVPDQPGKWEIPPLSISYFDPIDESFRAAEAELTRFTALAPLEAIPSVTTAEAQTPASPASEEEPNGERAEAAARWSRRPAYVAASAALLAALLLVPVGRRLLRRSEGRRRLCEQLRNATTMAHARRASEALERAWGEFLATRFEVPVGTAPRDWVAKLRRAGLKADRLAELEHLVEDFEYLRSAPELSASEALVADVGARSLKLARTLR